MRFSFSDFLLLLLLCRKKKNGSFDFSLTFFFLSFILLALFEKGTSEEKKKNMLGAALAGAVRRRAAAEVASSSPSSSAWRALLTTSSGPPAQAPPSQSAPAASPPPSTSSPASSSAAAPAPAAAKAPLFKEFQVYRYVCVCVRVANGKKPARCNDEGRKEKTNASIKGIVFAPWLFFFFVAHLFSLSLSLSCLPSMQQQKQINRWNPDKEDKPTYQSYKVDVNRSVLETKKTRGRKEIKNELVADSLERRLYFVSQRTRRLFFFLHRKRAFLCLGCLFFCR